MGNKNSKWNGVSMFLINWFAMMSLDMSLTHLIGTNICNSETIIIIIATTKMLISCELIRKLRWRTVSAVIAAFSFALSSYSCEWVFLAFMVALSLLFHHKLCVTDTHKFTGADFLLQYSIENDSRSSSSNTANSKIALMSFHLYLFINIYMEKERKSEQEIYVSSHFLYNWRIIESEPFQFNISSSNMSVVF